VIEFAEIDRDRCLEMLVAASGGVGRIAVSVSPPMIRPVNLDHPGATRAWLLIVLASVFDSHVRFSSG
jgi:hypothetical protein